MKSQSSSSGTKKHEKIGIVLQKFLQPKFNIGNDGYLNLFLTHLIDKNGNYIWQTNEQLKEQFCQWITEASNLWTRHKVNPQTSILSFALSLAGQLSADEQVFVRLNRQNVYERLVGVSQINSMNDPTVTLGLVTLLCSFLEHKSGLQWVLVTSHWTDMIHLGLKADNMCIRKKAYQFFIKLLEKTIRFNRNVTVNLVKLLVKPLKDVLRSLPNNQDTQPNEIESRNLFEILKPSLDFILEIVETMLKNFNRTVIQLFLEQETSEMIEKFLLLSQSEDFSFELLRIQFIFLFYKLVGKLYGMKVVAHDALLLCDGKFMLELIRNEILKNNVRCVLKICDYAHGVFCCLEPRMPTVIKEENTVEFQIQMMCFQMTLLYGFSAQMRSVQDLTFLIRTDLFRKLFFDRWCKMSVAPCIEVCYKWVESLEPKVDLVDDAIFCLQYVVKMKKLLNKERAATAFSVLVYSLTDCMIGLQKTQEFEFPPRFKCFQYLKILVEIIVDFVESFDLTWKDAIETISVMDLAYDFLLYPHWADNTIILKGLNLLNTAISKCMSPDMALLIYHTEDSKVSQTGSLLYAKCHDSCWEIRDSALKVVYTLSLNANTKFPAYTHILLKAELPKLVVDMALKDGEYYVRATALKCLQELIQISEVWNILSNMDTFSDDMLDVFGNETEGIVRKEAVALIYKIYKFQNFPEETLPRLYDVMTHAAIGDLHWEVKHNALDFWFNLWEQHLNRQGMIDRMFPSHTFSQEHKKIVALNEAEVRKRIIKVLYQLSHIGCLYVMKCAVQDDCDVEVSKKATSFTFDMLKMLRIYKVHYENVDLSEPPSPSTIQKSFTNQPFFEPASPASSCTMTAASPASIENLGSPQFDSTYFDPLSPLPRPFSPWLDLDLSMPSAPIESPFSIVHNSPLENKQAFHDAISIQSDSAFSKTLSSPITSNLNLSNGTDMFNYKEGCFDSDLDMEYIASVNSNSYNPVCREQILDEFVNSNDMTLLDGIYNPTDQVTNRTIQMKTRTYLAPSQYLRFIYNELETLTTKKTQRSNSLDAFDSLLDDILKDYNVVADINNMDCY